MINSLFQDLRIGVRHLARRRGFTAIALFTLALGIGAPTAIFSVVHAVLLRPLPYPAADRVVQFRISSDGPAGRVAFSALPASLALDWVAESRLLDGLALYNDRALTLETADGPYRLNGISATPNLFAILRTGPAAGRTFDDDSNEAREIVLSHATWSRYFQRDPNLVGRSITMDGLAYRVTGIMPQDFAFPSMDTAFWVPQPLSSGGSRGMLLPAVARLADGATVAAVAAEGQQRLREEGGPFSSALGVETLHNQMVGGVARLLWVLAGAVVFLTLIATVTLALLMLTRGADRAREFSVRTALGAGPGRLLRQLAVETAALGAAGGLAGLALAAMLIQLLLSVAPPDLPRLQSVDLSRDVLLFAMALTAGTTVVFGLASAARSVTFGSWPARITSAHRIHQQTRPIRRPLTALAAAGLALTLVLLAAAGLLARSFAGLVTTDQGFDAGDALVLQVNLPASRYPTPEARWAQQRRILDLVRTMPAIRSAGLTTTLPTRQPTGRFGFSASPGILALDEPFSMPVVDVHMVVGNFMETMGLRLVAGRFLDDRDTTGAQPAVVISEQFAREQFRDRAAVGAWLYSHSGNRLVVGVVQDVRTSEQGGTKQADAYLPLSQNTTALDWLATTTLVVRGGDAAALAQRLRPVLLSLDASSPPFNARALSADAARAVAGPRFSLIVVSAFGLVALVMASAGTYGVMAYLARLRTREIGVRLAVGASRAQILRLVLGSSVRTIALGVGAGVLGALLLTRTLAGLLHDVAPSDPGAIAVAAALLAATSLLASWGPARRAMRVDPVRVLGDE